MAVSWSRVSPAGRVVVRGAVPVPIDSRSPRSGATGPSGAARPTFDFTALIDGLETTHKVRVATLDGAPWFVAGDVCRVLGLARHADGSFSRHLSRLSADERRKAPTSQLGGSTGGFATLVSEAGLFRLIMRSDKPIARPFQDWVVREVLPAIRKTGGYVLAGADPAAVEVGAAEMMPLPATFTEALRQHAATAQNGEQQHKRGPARPPPGRRSIGPTIAAWNAQLSAAATLSAA